MVEKNKKEEQCCSGNQIHHPFLQTCPNDHIKIIPIRDIPDNCQLDCVGPFCTLVCFGELPQTSGPPYGNFWQTTLVTVPLGQAFPFSNSGPTAGGVSLLDPATISVVEAVDYRVSFRIAAFSGYNTEQRQPGVAVFMNGNRIHKLQTTFEIAVTDIQDTFDIRELSGEAIISIPANSTLQLRNVSIAQQPITALDGGVNYYES